MGANVTFTPARIDFGGVAPGSSGPDITVDPSAGPPHTSFAGGVQITNAPVDARITAHIENDTTHFMVRDVIIMQWEVEEIAPSELPPNHHGPPPLVQVLEPIT